MSHSYENRDSVIFNISEIAKVDFSQILETFELKKSVDGTKVFIKWEHGFPPSFLDSLTTKEGPYTYEEIGEIMLTSEWEQPFIV